MAELTKPAYSPNLRLNIPTARVSGSVPTSSSSRPINTGQKESHNAQMAKIAIDGISKLENAYDVAEMQQVRHEMNEEMTKMDKHFGDMTDINLKDMIFKRQMKEIEDDLPPFGHIDDGSEHIESIQQKEDNPWMIEYDNVS